MSDTSPYTAENPAAGIVWNLTDYFAGYLDDDYRAMKRHQEEAWPALVERLRELGAPTDATLDAWEAALLEAESLNADATHLSSYVGCLSSADGRDETVKRELGALALVWAEFEKAFKLIELGLRDADDATFARLVERPALASARYVLGRMRQRGQWSMGPALEGLAADLGVDGLGAWGRLYGQIASTLEFEMRWPDGRVERIPMAQRNELLDHDDAAVRRAALAGSNAAWETMQESVAACLNHLGGARHTLYKRRGVANYLDVAMFDGAVERATVEAMWEAIGARRTMLHDFLRRKARLLGLDRLGFQDIHAPLPQALLERLGDGAKEERTILWPQARGFVLDAFAAAYPALAEYAESFFARGFFEAEKRPGKRPGGFCTTSYRTRQSRIFMNFTGTLDDVQTIAHELGHAFHSFVMRDLRPFNLDYPMTLAETASTFAEALLSDHLLASPATTSAQRLRILTQRLNDVCTYLLNIHMRYVFERSYYDERADGIVTVPRLKELMRAAQAEVYGAVLDPDQPDEYFWASKGHFYITDLSFYNYPYTFGYLLSQALAARTRAEGAAFLPRYEAFLCQTGSATCEEVARATLGVDLRNPAFWAASIDVLAPDFARFEELTAPALEG